MKRIFLIGMCFLLSSCANIPLSTMLKFSSFDENTLLELNPNNLKTKIHLDKPLLINLNTTDLSLTLETSKGETQYRYPLKLISKKEIPVKNGWFSSAPERTEYTLALSPAAIVDFHKLKKSMRSEKPKGMSFSVSTSFEPLAEFPEEGTMSVFIKLTNDADYTTLIDRATIKFEQTS